MIGKFKCPVCSRRAAELAAVESAPGKFRACACPACGCYLRDCFVWQILSTYQTWHSARLRIIEIGGTRRLRRRYLANYHYRNADVTSGAPGVDYAVLNGRIEAPPAARFDVAILSFVLSVVSSKEERVRLLSSLRTLVVPGGVMILFDDIDLTSPVNMPIKGFFHGQRLGANLNDELASAGWRRITRILSIEDRSHFTLLDFPVFVIRGGRSRATDLHLSSFDSLGEVFSRPGSRSHASF